MSRASKNIFYSGEAGGIRGANLDTLTHLMPVKFLAKAIESAIQEAGISQIDLARLSTLNPSTISRLITAKVAADANTLDALLLAFPSKKIKSMLVVAYLK